MANKLYRKLNIPTLFLQSRQGHLPFTLPILSHQTLLLFLGIHLQTSWLPFQISTTLSSNTQTLLTLCCQDHVVCIQQASKANLPVVITSTTITKSRGLRCGPAFILESPVVFCCSNYRLYSDYHLYTLVHCCDYICNHQPFFTPTFFRIHLP